jgi:hypothetical protein
MQTRFQSLQSGPAGGRVPLDERAAAPAGAMSYDLPMRFPRAIEPAMAAVALYLTVIAGYSTVRFFMILAGH